MLKNKKCMDIPDKIAKNMTDDVGFAFAKMITSFQIMFYRLYNIEKFSYVIPMCQNHQYFRYPIIEMNAEVKNITSISSLCVHTNEKLQQTYNKQYLLKDQLSNKAKIAFASTAINTQLDIEFIYDLDEIDFFACLNQNDEKTVLEIWFSNNYLESEIRSIFNTIILILKAILSKEEDDLNSVTIISDSDRNRISRFTFNEQMIREEHHSIFSLLYKLATVMPEKAAIIYNSVSPENKSEIKICTYKELIELANHMAAIISAYIEPRETVMVKAENPLLISVGVLGCFIAGIPFIPMAPEIPDTRRNEVISSNNVRIVITDDKWSDLNTKNIYQVCLEDIITRSHFMEKGNYNHNHAGYIIYTSGSTGSPKSFFISESALRHYCLWRIEQYDISHEDVTLQLLSLSFDGFLSNFFTSLLSGGTLIMPDSQHKNRDKYVLELIKSYRVTCFSIVPCILELLLDTATDKDLESLRLIVFGGDFTSSSLRDKCKKLNPKVWLINEYGPSENGIASTANLNFCNSDTANIGVPLPGVQVYVLNKWMQMVPTHIQGDIYIGGENLTSGYIAGSSLYKKFFVPHPYAEGEILFKTGDFGYWDDEGCLYLVGRSDNQININGCRIELEEVEQAIKKCELVQQAVVSVSYEKGRTILYADVKGRNGLTSRTLRNYLLDILPTYMIPQRIVISGQVPLSVQGKPVRKRDEDFHGDSAVLQQATEIINIWKVLLKKQDMSIYDDFFECGGSSIIIVQFINYANTTLFKNCLKAIDIFKYSTAYELAQYIYTNMKEGFM